MITNDYYNYLTLRLEQLKLKITELSLEVDSIIKEVSSFKETKQPTIREQQTKRRGNWPCRGRTELTTEEQEWLNKWKDKTIIITPVPKTIIDEHGANKTIIL